MQYTDEKVAKKPRKYFHETFDAGSLEQITDEFDGMLSTEIDSVDNLLAFLEKSTELGNMISEHMAWLYIDMTRFADNEEYKKKFNDYYSTVISKVQSFDHKIKQKFYASPYRERLDDKQFGLLNRIISNDIEMFREENIPLHVQEQELANEYGTITGAMTVDFRSKERTLQQMRIFLKEPDRALRENVFHLIGERFAKDVDKLDVLFDKLIGIRQQVAKNAGFDNYRDYSHKAKGRFAYEVKDVLEFHDSVEKAVVPFLRELTEERRDKLEIDDVRPWDVQVDLDGRQLVPFENTDDFVRNGVNTLYKVHPDFGIELEKMKNSDYLDLDNRKGKAPGGYCYPLAEHNSSFIFMNAVGLHRDLVTLVHEAGHTMHNLASKHIRYEQYQDKPSEVAELASMAMEFLTMDYWDNFYKDPADLRKARTDQLEDTVKFLPWCMIVDAFQHWVYTNPGHTVADRRAYFASLMERFNTGVNWDSLDYSKSVRWMQQLHIFEVPFYYIEYGISQLGALAVYRNYKRNPEQAVKKYREFLALSYSVPMDKLYRAAGIEFDFSEKYIAELLGFVRDELRQLKS